MTPPTAQTPPQPQDNTPAVQAPDEVSSGTHNMRAADSFVSEAWGTPVNWNTLGRYAMTDTASKYVGDLELTDFENDGPQNSDGTPGGKRSPAGSDTRAETEKSKDGGETDEAQSGTEVDAIRKKLLDNGIDPDKMSTPIAIREPRTSDPEEARLADAHITQVGCHITDPELGLSRNSEVQHITDRVNFKSLAEVQDQPDGLQQFFRSQAQEILDSTTRVLQENFLAPDSKLRVMNISYGISPVDVASAAVSEMKDNPEKFAATIKKLLGEEKGNQFIAESKAEPPHPVPPELTPGQCTDIRQPNPGSDDPNRPMDPQKATPLESELYKKLVESFERSMASDPAIKESMERYRETTREVAAKGGILVIAAGNAGDTALHFNTTSTPGSEFNILGKSDHVIVAGGSDINGTPGDASDDRMFEASSRGDNRYPPTVLAPGLNVPSRQSEDGILAGTSLAAPMITGTIGLMLEQNPNLSFNDVKRLLQSNVHRIPSVGSEHQGAGILRIADVIIAARQSRSQTR